MRSSTIYACLTAFLLGQEISSQAVPDNKDASGFEHSLEPLKPLGIDTSTLPTYLVIASGAVPQITAGALDNPIAVPTAITTASSNADANALESKTDVHESSSSISQEESTQMTSTTTTLFTVANGSTTTTALTTTVPVSVVPIAQDRGSSLASRKASSLIFSSSSILVFALLS
ncbi:hypothetical protein P389DRAFT_67971 [Cystobasidium minutum MCA 4210]|uniref:uncharacterized protein n=1 Tax=Cystobasidium minutum MCA 4210 TaxID=1397322 RepID=UPI0034CF3F73|eukprot:jgi/Rhomi1/67971/CE67970_1048